MRIKGITFISRKYQIIDNYGEARWKDFHKKIIQKEPIFESVITSSLIPFEKFLIFVEEFKKEFYKNVPNAYFRMGYDQAEWALLKGPYQPLLKNKDLKSFINVSLPTLWNVYFTAGKTDIKYDEDENVVIIHIYDLPVKHPYLESVAGYVLRAFELLTEKPVRIEKIKDIMKDGEMMYKYYL